MNGCIYLLYRSVLSSARRSRGWVSEGEAWMTFSVSNVVAQNYSVKSISSSSSSWWMIQIQVFLIIKLMLCSTILCWHTHTRVGRENHSSHFSKECLAASSPQGLYCISGVERLCWRAWYNPAKVIWLQEGDSYQKKDRLSRAEVLGGR